MGVQYAQKYFERVKLHIFFELHIFLYNNGI
jgi:hypothetical protein